MCGSGWFYGQKQMTTSSISGGLSFQARERKSGACGRTPENVVLVVLVSFGSHFDETREPLCHHKLVHQILVILEERGESMRTLQVYTWRNGRQMQSLQVQFSHTMCWQGVMVAMTKPPLYIVSGGSYRIRPH